MICKLRIFFISLVHEADSYGVREGPLDVHGTVGVSQWHRQVPRLLQLHQEEERRLEAYRGHASLQRLVQKTPAFSQAHFKIHSEA